LSLSSSKSATTRRLTWSFSALRASGSASALTTPRTSSRSHICAKGYERPGGEVSRDSLRGATRHRDRPRTRSLLLARARTHGGDLGCQGQRARELRRRYAARLV